ncbi:MAG: TonB-dependent receptor [Bacteroidales bacterium]|nr:TonB-dependent receptor [Bacteroidales bacterium]
MKITAVLLFCSMLNALASPTYSQITKISLNLNNSSIEDVLDNIEAQSEFYFLYNQKLVDVSRKVDIVAENKPIKDVLDDIFKNEDVKYLVYDRQIILTSKEESGKMVELQQKKITGTVSNDKKEPLPGVTIMVKGTTIGALSGIDGKYTLNNVPDGSTIVFSFIGMQTQEIQPGTNNLVNVTLIEESIGLDEVVVIGYGSVKKRDISTSIASVSTEALKDKPVSNFQQAMSGQLAGVRILNSNNAPGGGSTIRIRGVTSINASNDPLIVIDGFPLKDGFSKTENPLNAINTADIESIEVLKDASSSAIYGARAANGVIMITTKKGKTGKATINLNISTGYEKMIHRMNTLNKEDFLKFMDDSRAQAYIVEDPNFGTNDPNAPLWSWNDDNATRIFNWTNYSSNAAPMKAAGPGNLYERWITVTDATKARPYDTDWQDVATQIGKVQDIQLSTTGGTENLKYMVSGGYYNQDGILKAAGYKRFSFRANVDVKINNWFKTGLLLAPTFENTNVIANLENTFYNLASIAPLYEPYDENGDPAYLGYTPGYWAEWNLSSYVNPLINSMVEDKRRTAKNLSTLYGEINLTKDLVFRSEFHTEFKNWERNYFLPSSYPTASATYSRSQGLDNITSRLYYNSQNYLTYNHAFGKHSVNAILGYSAEKTSDRSTYINKYDYPTDAVHTLNQATVISNAQNDARTNRSSETMIGSFARLMYNYGGKYYMTASVRRDGSSNFGADTKWGIFPSFSLAWRVSDESFFTPLKNYINDLKIRGGAGVIGNSGIGRFNAISSLSATSYIFGSGSTLAAGYQDAKVANSGLKWETTTDYGIGTDIEFLKSRISFSMDYYYKLTKDMLFDMPLPLITGFGSYMVNIGSMRNRGFEYQLTTRNFTGEFRWTTTFNLSYYRNKVLNTGAHDRPLINNNAYTIEGKPLSGLYGGYFLGAYNDWEDVKTNPIVNPTNPKWMYRSYPGAIKLFDVNGDGVIDGLDNTIIGNPNPDFIWGMTNTFEYKGFDLSVQVNGVQGGERLMTQMEPIMAKNSGSQNTVHLYYDNYWRPDRTDGTYAAPTRKSWDGTSTRGVLVFKGTYVNIQNVALGYSLPKSITSKLNVSQIRPYISVQNAFLITKYPGYNPEVNYGDDYNAALSQGMDNGAYPLTRIISFGINLSL